MRIFHYFAKNDLTPDGTDTNRLKLNAPKARPGSSIMIRVDETLKELVFEKKLTDFDLNKKSENISKLHQLIFDKKIPNACHIYQLIDNLKHKTRTLQMKVYNEAKYGFCDKKCSILDCLIDVSTSKFI